MTIHSPSTFEPAKVKQTLHDQSSHLTFTLTQVLFVQSDSGDVVAEINAPFGMHFEYLDRDGTDRVGVVCSEKRHPGGTLDWRFDIDLSAKTLVNKGRAY